MNLINSKLNWLQISTDKSIIGHADPPTDIATITVQLQTPLRTDGTRANIAEYMENVPILCDESRRLITLNENGVETFTVGAIAPGILTIHADRAHTLNSNTIVIEVI